MYTWSGRRSGARSVRTKTCIPVPVADPVMTVSAHFILEIIVLPRLPDSLILTVLTCFRLSRLQNMSAVKRSSISWALLVRYAQRCPVDTIFNNKLKNVNVYCWHRVNSVFRSFFHQLVQGSKTED